MSFHRTCCCAPDRPPVGFPCPGQPCQAGNRVLQSWDLSFTTHGGLLQFEIDNASFFTLTQAAFPSNCLWQRPAAQAISIIGSITVTPSPPVIVGALAYATIQCTQPTNDAPCIGFDMNPPCEYDGFDSWALCLFISLNVNSLPNGLPNFIKTFSLGYHNVITPANQFTAKGTYNYSDCFVALPPGPNISPIVISASPLLVT